MFVSCSELINNYFLKCWLLNDFTSPELLCWCEIIICIFHELHWRCEFIRCGSHISGGSPYILNQRCVFHKFAIWMFHISGAPPEMWIQNMYFHISQLEELLRRCLHIFSPEMWIRKMNSSHLWSSSEDVFFTSLELLRRCEFGICIVHISRVPLELWIPKMHFSHLIAAPPEMWRRCEFRRFTFHISGWVWDVNSANVMYLSHFWSSRTCGYVNSEDAVFISLDMWIQIIQTYEMLAAFNQIDNT